MEYKLKNRLKRSNHTDRAACLLTQKKDQNLDIAYLEVSS
jgi:hypothetical protein